MTNESAKAHKTPGLLQGMMLLLPITMAVVGVSTFTSTVVQMQQHFSDVPNADYLVNILQTIPGIWIFLFSPVAGMLADRFGRLRLLLVTMVVYALIGAAPYLIDNLYLILLTRCGVGICESVVMTVTTTMLSDYFKGRVRERWLAAQTGVASLSALVIIPLGGYLGNKYGWQGPFLVYLYSLILALGVAVFCWEPEKNNDESAAGGIHGDDAIYQSLPLWRLLGICAITLPASVMFYTPITQNANAFVTLGITDTARIGVFSTYASLGVPTGTLLFWLVGRLHINWLLAVDFLLLGAGFIGMSVATTPSAYIIATNVQQIGCGMVLPTLLIWATRGLAYHIRGRGTGIWQGALAIGAFVSGAALTWMGKQLGGLFPAFSLLGKACLMAALLAVIAKLVRGDVPTGYAP
jgi:MFS family permease